MMMGILEKAWSSRGWIACLLWPLSQIYRFAIGLRSLLYRHQIFTSRSTGVLTIVIGNVVAGGGGKTPLVIFLANHLQGRGYRVGVLSRGFGRTSSACLEVFPATLVHESGDEPALIKRATCAPVFVASRRFDAATALLSKYPQTQVILCDDGLQHHALARDLEIAVFDDRGIGNGWLLPAGPLREEWPRQHRKVDLVLHTGQTPAFAGFRSGRSLADHAVAVDSSRVALASLVGCKVHAVAAIANPDAFFTMLRSCGLVLERTIALPDHDDFANFRPAHEDGAIWLCTEKDAVKLFALPVERSMQILAVALQFSPEPGFVSAFDSMLRPLLCDLTSHHGHKTA